MPVLLIFNLVLILSILIAIIFLILYIKSKTQKFTREYFQTDSLKEAIAKSNEIAQNTPKSISNMESFIIPSLNKDYPDLNINEIKGLAQTAITDCLKSIESKSTEDLNYNNIIKSWVEAKISDLKDSNVSINSIKFHQTSLNKYEKNKGIATLTIASSIEYICKRNNEVSKKIQERYITEFIYIIDESKVSKEMKGLGLNCPNCGAPITTLGEKYCTYCGTGIKEIVKKSWTLNNIANY